MKLPELIKQSSRPQTKTLIKKDLKSLGIKGETVIVHSALSRLGWVCGGAQTIVEALKETVTVSGTIVMPTHTPKWSDPSEWCEPCVPEEWWPTIREEMPAFDPKSTPSEMGAVVECFRTSDGVVRSDHPQFSFSAWGRECKEIIANHPLNHPLDDRSPVGKIYERNGWVLLLGVGYEANTSMHLGEHHVPFIPISKNASAMIVNGERKWVTYDSLEYGDELFAQIGEAFERQNPTAVIHGKVGLAPIKLMPQRKIVDFTSKWLKNHKDQLPFMQT